MVCLKDNTVMNFSQAFIVLIEWPQQTPYSGKGQKSVLIFWIKYPQTAIRCVIPTSTTISVAKSTNAEYQTLRGTMRTSSHKPVSRSDDRSVKGAIW